MKLKISIIGLTIGLIFNTAAEDILASKEGPFNNYNYCSLTHDRGTLEIRNGSRSKIVETSMINVTLKDFEELAAPAIAGKGREFNRWYPTTTNYSVRGANEVLEKFYSHGFFNIINDSSAAQELMLKIDDVCSTQLNDFRIIGKFQVDLKIGNRVFEDKLIIKRTNETFMGAVIEGTYEVPNSFESKVKDLNYKDGIFTFTIRVREGDDDYKTSFEGTLNQDGHLEGKALILPARTLLGTFTGKRI